MIQQLSGGARTFINGADHFPQGLTIFFLFDPSEGDLGLSADNGHRCAYAVCSLCDKVFRTGQGFL